MIVNFLIKIFSGGGLPTSETVDRIVFIYKFAATFVSLGLIIGIIYVILRINEMQRRDKVQAPKSTPVSGGQDIQKENPKWIQVIEHIGSSNSSDWRLAILEADIMLNEMLDSMNYHGETLGDKLKAIEQSDFATLDKAWEAHKIRNLIAHEGTSFNLSRIESRRVINLYRDVFLEFRYI